MIHRTLSRRALQAFPVSSNLRLVRGMPATGPDKTKPMDKERRRSGLV